MPSRTRPAGRGAGPSCRARDHVDPALTRPSGTRLSHGRAWPGRREPSRRTPGPSACPTRRARPALPRSRSTPASAEPRGRTAPGCRCSPPPGPDRRGGTPGRRGRVGESGLIVQRGRFALVQRTGEHDVEAVQAVAHHEGRSAHRTAVKDVDRERGRVEDVPVGGHAVLGRFDHLSGAVAIAAADRHRRSGAHAVRWFGAAGGRSNPGGPAKVPLSTLTCDDPDSRASSRSTSPGSKPNPPAKARTVDGVRTSPDNARRTRSLIRRVGAGSDSDSSPASIRYSATTAHTAGRWISVRPHRGQAGPLPSPPVTAGRVQQAA